MHRVVCRSVLVTLAFWLLVAQVVPSWAARPALADASACSSPGFVLQRAPLADSSGDDVAAARGRFTEEPLRPQSLNVAEISVTMLASPNLVLPGTNLTYTITVSNTGPNDATDMELTDVMSAGTTFVSLTDPGGCWFCTTPAVGVTGTVSCSHPHQFAGDNDVFVLVVLVDGGVPTGTPIENTASITANVSDPVGGDHSITTNTSVGPATPTPTLTPTVTSTPTVTPTGTITPVTTTVPTATATPTAPPTKSTSDDKSKPKTDTQRQQDDHSNQLGRDDYHTEGNVVEVVLDANPPYAMIATRDGLVQVLLRCDGGCPTVRPGDYVQVDGVKENEGLFTAEDISVSR